VDGLVEVLRPYGVLEMVRTGRVAIDRGSVQRDNEASRGSELAMGSGNEPGISCSV
jgi:hypothetical protein